MKMHRMIDNLIFFIQKNILKMSSILKVINFLICRDFFNFFQFILIFFNLF